MKKSLTLVLVALTTVIIGCQNRESASNTPWTIRAKSRIEMQNQPDELEEYFARYEKNFLANEREYYRLDDLPTKDPDGNYYAQSEDDDNQDSQERVY